MGAAAFVVAGAGAGALASVGATEVGMTVMGGAGSTPAPAINTVVLPNWAGPVVYGSTYDEVATTFVVPQATCSLDRAATDASFWAGFDGAGAPGGSATLEQAGVRVSCQAGSAQYVAWTEQYPAGEDDINPAQFSVQPGDTVTVDAAARDATDTYTIRDVTSGTSFTRTSRVPAGATDASAECIAEAPEHGTALNTYYPLTDFGTVTFSQCAAHAAAPVAGDCQVVTGQGCPAASQILYSTIGNSETHPTNTQANFAATQSGAFTVTWNHS